MSGERRRGWRRRSLRLPGTQGLPQSKDRRGKGRASPPCPPLPSPISPQHGVTNTHHRGTWASGASLRAAELSFAAPSCGVEPGAGVSVQNQGAWATGPGRGHQQRLGAAPCRARGRGHKQGLGAVRANASLLPVNARSREGTSFSYFANDCTLLQRKSGRPALFLSVHSFSLC